MRYGTEKTYTIEEIARMLRVAPHTVLKYLRAGMIIGEKQDGKWLVSESALAEFFATPTFDFVNRMLPMLSAYKPKK